MNLRHIISYTAMGVSALYMIGCTSQSTVPVAPAMPEITATNILEQTLADVNSGRRLRRALQEGEFYFAGAYATPGFPGSRTAEIVGNGWLNGNLIRIVEQEGMITASSPTLDSSGINTCVLSAKGNNMMASLLQYKTGELIDKRVTTSIGTEAPVYCTPRN